MQISRSHFPGYFIYAGPFRTEQRAYDELEDMYATGDVFQSEGPAVKAVRDHHNRVKGYAVLLKTEG